MACLAVHACNGDGRFAKLALEAELEAHEGVSEDTLEVEETGDSFL